ncbi:hypothetical protein Q3A66_15540 [Hymenobacter sp. BT770]|uniref:hypothetical protein n=1 Tax=Hymenobacter sp. BT770 TaxID=2886942 RepID=UPI001D11EA85|nr:hypothetical protein [Hymenobacter sp. BT770]MCC3154453.1 hypothetical protein [Hymenobacter sp. BT770]MDO3416482.1 hypothetical protein [Hymenobacter sp. BT770]
MKHFFLVLCLWLPRTVLAFQPLEPLQIAEQFVAPAGWPDMKAYLCCEAAGQAKRETLGQQIPARLQRVCQLVQQGSTTAVVAVELRDSLDRKDFYLHFGKEAGAWKLLAIRNLAMTHLGPPMVELLAAMPPAAVAEYDQKHPDASHAFTLGNLRLWTSADADIAAHFARNRADFQKVLRLVQAGKYFAPSGPAATTEQTVNADPAVHALLRKLYLAQVTRGQTGCESCLEFVIGGKVSSTVGLLYQPQATLLPAMSPDHLIVLKPLGAGWYLYKTV